MSLFYKTLTKLQRSLYLYFPGEENRTPFKRCSLTVLMDDVTQESVEAALRDLHLQELADQQELILSFPVPVQGGWNASLDPAGPDDVMVFRAMQDALAKVDDAPLPVNAIGIPTLEAMLSTWHPMNDTKYVLGIGSGADMALTLAATSPDNLAAVVAVQGTLYPLALEQAAYAPMPVWLCGCDQGAAAYTPGNFKWVGRLTPQEYGDRISRADLIISHAGMGSIITALQLGKPIVVLPRRGHLRETRNDHQYATVQRLGNRPGIFVAEDETRLPVVLDQAVSGLAGAGGIGISRVAEPRLTMAIGRFLAGKPLPEKS